MWDGDMAGNMTPIVDKACGSGSFRQKRACLDRPGDKSASKWFSGRIGCDDITDNGDLLSMCASQSCEGKARDKCCKCGGGSSGDDYEDCLPCPPGTWGNASDATECTPCVANTFSNVTGAFAESSCLPCPPHSTSDRGSSSCRCNAGYFGDGISNCVACPLHSSSAKGSEACLCDEGYFGNGTSCHPCPSNSASATGRASCFCTAALAAWTAATNLISEEEDYE